MPRVGIETCSAIRNAGAALAEQLIAVATNEFKEDVKVNRKQKLDPFIKILEGAHATAYQRPKFGVEQFPLSHKEIPIADLAIFAKTVESDFVLHDEVSGEIDKLCHLSIALADPDEFDSEHCKPIFLQLFVHETMAPWGMVIRAFLSAGLNPLFHPNQAEASELTMDRTTFKTYSDFIANVYGIMSAIRYAASQLFYDHTNQERANNVLTAWKAEHLPTGFALVTVSAS